MVMRILLLTLAIFSSQLAFALDKLSASVDKNPVLAGEYFTLSIVAEGKVKGTIPDVSSLSKDFVTSPVSTSSRTSIINGSVTSSTTWQLQLVARKPGEYTIPAFEVDGAKTAPISLKVVAQQTDGDSKDIFIKTELKPNTLYVQQAGLYTVKLYVGKDLLDGNLSDPVADTVTMTQISKHTEDYEIIDGRRYLVVTRQYLVQPQKSGNLTVDPPVFSGQVREGYRRMAVNALADEVALEVKPIPQQHADNWLPSEYVNFADEWQPSSSEITAGTPITRTFTLTAVGVTKEQLPEIKVEDVNGFKIYPDTSERKQMVRDGKVISQITASFAYLPQAAGQYTLPEVKLPWFNTVLNRTDLATIAEKAFVVKADPNQVVQANTTPNPVAGATSTDTQSQQPAVSASAVNPIGQFAIPLWVWAVCASGYLLWIITLVLYIKKRPVPINSNSPTAKPTTSQSANSRLKQAAKNNDAKQFYTALMDLVATQHTSFADWLNQQPDELQSDIKTMQQSLFKDGATSTVQLEKLYQALSKSERKKRAEPTHHLAPLFE
ncbi:BatD family protein (plasmid) [Pseudoalteromonas sp. T1lg65]|uniref:BatD family protein n=1 Tax=Pseudoalteromonas sp. T1lg65 TaxID=2077101 RepID=UPI003F7A6168